MTAYVVGITDSMLMFCCRINASVKTMLSSILEIHSAQGLWHLLVSVRDHRALSRSKSKHNWYLHHNCSLAAMAHSLPPPLRIKPTTLPWVRRWGWNVVDKEKLHCTRMDTPVWQSWSLWETKVITSLIAFHQTLSEDVCSSLCSVHLVVIASM